MEGDRGLGNEREEGGVQGEGWVGERLLGSWELLGASVAGAVEPCTASSTAHLWEYDAHTYCTYYNHQLITTTVRVCINTALTSPCSHIRHCALHVSTTW